MDKAFTGLLLWLTKTSLFNNRYVDEQTGKSLIWLLGFDANKKLMTDLFLLIYKDKATDTIIKDFTRDVISDYLKTEHCTRNLAFITVENALKD